jgi:hypothetical protein
MQDSIEFTTRMEKGHLSVAHMLQENASRHVSKNRQILKAILKIIVFCGRQNIALRGHNESTKSSHNPGNFRALLDFRIDAGDPLLGGHFSHSPRNAQYHSPVIQNELITCCGEWIQRGLIQEILNARYFSICADEAADSSNKEQPFVVHFVDEACTTREENHSL